MGTTHALQRSFSVTLDGVNRSEKNPSSFTCSGWLIRPARMNMKNRIENKASPPLIKNNFLFSDFPNKMKNTGISNLRKKAFSRKDTQ